MSQVHELNAITLTLTSSALRMRLTETPKALVADADCCHPSLTKISNSAFWEAWPLYPLPEYTWIRTLESSPLLVR